MSDQGGSAEWRPDISGQLYRESGQGRQKASRKQRREKQMARLGMETFIFLRNLQRPM
jgi:hypothetical protein